MTNRKKSAFTRASMLGLLAAGLLTFSMTGCDKGTDPVAPSGPCADDPTLCTPRAALRDTGDAVFHMNCTGCHGLNGEGERAPQLANSDFLMNHRERTIQIVLQGNHDSIRVNGVFYEGGGMPIWGDQLSNVEIAGVLTYLRSTLNDSLVTDCKLDDLDENGWPKCTKTARDSVAMDLDSISVLEVKTVRDTLPPLVF